MDGWDWRRLDQDADCISGSVFGGAGTKRSPCPPPPPPPPVTLAPRLDGRRIRGTRRKGPRVPAQKERGPLGSQHRGRRRECGEGPDGHVIGVG